MRRRMEGTVIKNYSETHLREVSYMKQKVKLKGHLKSYLQTTLILGILLAFVNVDLFSEYKGRYLCIRIFSDLPVDDDYFII